ncbi:Uncharacterized protein QTN25_004581 [Entamoeba marina]
MNNNDSTIYETLQSIKKKKIPIRSIPKQDSNKSMVVKRWKMSKNDRITMLETLGMDKTTEPTDPMYIPSYYYKSNKVNPTIYAYQENTKQRKGQDEREGKRTRAVKQGKFVIK